MVARLLVVALALLVACGAPAAPAPLMAAYRDGPSASVLVLRDGKAVVRESVGFADLEAHDKASPATTYRLASISKQFTAAAVLLLREDGVLKLEDRVQTWLPALPSDAITIEHLLTHTSGLVDYEDFMPDGLTRQLHDADVLDIVARHTPAKSYFAPGTNYRYSNSGYALLALIVEKASRKSFADFLAERIFRPLHMTSTVAHEDGKTKPVHRAFGYTFVDNAWKRTDQSLTSAVLGDGGIYSSIDDLAKWDAALYDDRLLKSESRSLAFTPKTKTDDPNVHYGFGWRITGDSLWHSGESVGFRNVIVRFPKRKLTVIILTNRNEPEPYQRALEIAAKY